MRAIITQRSQGSIDIKVDKRHTGSCTDVLLDKAREKKNLAEKAVSRVELPSR